MLLDRRVASGAGAATRADAAVRVRLARAVPAVIVTDDSSAASLDEMERVGLDVTVKPVRPDDIGAAIAGLTHPTNTAD